MRIREERKTDLDPIRNINNLAFGREEEGRIVDKLRDAGTLIISLVAVRDYVENSRQLRELVGHIGFSPVAIESESTGFQAVCLGPVSVLPNYQKQGIGIKLVKAGLSKCLASGHPLVVLVGHPTYYPRFGFVQARRLGIECEYSQTPDDAWMLIELREGVLAGRHGTVKFQPEFREAV